MGLLRVDLERFRPVTGQPVTGQRRHDAELETKGETVKRKLTAEQTAARDARRERFKGLWQQVARMPEAQRIEAANKLGLVTAEGHALSMKNQLLIALQLPGASVVGGFRQWLKHGRCVRKGEHGAMIWVPCGCRSNNVPLDGTSGGVSAVADGESTSDGDSRFIVGTVFDIGQTQELDATTVAESEAV